MSKILGIPCPYKLGAQNHLFGPTSQLNGNINGLYLRNETRYRQSVKCVDNCKGSPTSFQNVMKFGPQTASNWTATFTTLCKFCFLHHCQASQTEISKQNSTKLFQRWMVNRANNLPHKSWIVPPEKWLLRTEVTSLCGDKRGLEAARFGIDELTTKAWHHYKNTGGACVRGELWIGVERMTPCRIVVHML